ncbi:hypothetical protein M595_3558 [Lyngbya aestuarii BL J]|uniref:Uncharacterized protein n=1 Tax=Lyngbya aestuarii BL J TaxID=1348334 RepID=U7QET1_9CYAN|nr:hypothetical protein M595_3558 [Lyngbya aestuarii BL J]
MFQSPCGEFSFGKTLTFSPQTMSSAFQSPCGEFSFGKYPPNSSSLVTTLSVSIPLRGI